MYELLFVAAVSAISLNPPLGHLVIVGGGHMTPEILEKTLDIAGGKEARVLIIPQASAWTGAGQRSLLMWQEAGATRVTILDPDDRRAALRAVKRADLIWMPGGSQYRLMHTLTAQGLTEAIRVRYQQGATVGGTSAGAAVMSRIMLMGIPKVKKVTAFIEASGLGLWPDVIVDQHYLRRHRFPRLLNAVLHHPDKLGIGIDESTAVLVEGRHFEVIGNSEVMVLDARRLGRGRVPRDSPSAAKVAKYLLKEGMKFDLDKAKLPKYVAREGTKFDLDKGSRAR